MWCAVCIISHLEHPVFWVANGLLRSERSQRDYYNPVLPKVGGLGRGEDHEERGGSLTLLVDTIRKLQQVLRRVVYESVAELHLHGRPASVVQVDDGICLEPRLFISALSMS